MELIHEIQEQILNFHDLFLKNLLIVLIWSKQFSAQNQVTNQSSKLKLREVTLIFLAFELKTALIRLKQTTNFLKKKSGFVVSKFDSEFCEQDIFVIKTQVDENKNDHLR